MEYEINHKTQKNNNKKKTRMLQNATLMPFRSLVAQNIVKRWEEGVQECTPGSEVNYESQSHGPHLGFRSATTRG